VSSFFHQVPRGFWFPPHEFVFPFPLGRCEARDLVCRHDVLEPSSFLVRPLTFPSLEICDVRKDLSTAAGAISVLRYTRGLLSYVFSFPLASQSPRCQFVLPYFDLLLPAPADGVGLFFLFRARLLRQVWLTPLWKTCYGLDGFAPVCPPSIYADSLPSA